ncbi:MAG: hypothetical protein QM777_14060 [Pseudorhodoferax sp.]
MAPKTTWDFSFEGALGGSLGIPGVFRHPHFEYTHDEFDSWHHGGCPRGSDCGRRQAIGSRSHINSSGGRKHKESQIGHILKKFLSQKGGNMNDCENLLTFDTTLVKTDFATQFAFLSSVTEQNYEDMKRDFSAFVPGYFDGSYSEFNQKRNVTTQLVSLSSSASFAQTYQKRSLSPGAAESYAKCLVENSRKLIGAWISHVSDDIIVVSVRTGATGTDKITVTAKPASLKIDPITLLPGSVTAIPVDYDKRKDFLLVLNAKSENSGTEDSTVVEYPKRRSLEMKTEVTEVKGYIEAGAGFNGNSAANPHWLDADLLAPDGSYFKRETLTELSREKVWADGGLRNFVLEVTEGRDSSGRLVRLRLHPRDIDGTDGHRQGNVRIHYMVRAYRDYVVDKDAQMAQAPLTSPIPSIISTTASQAITWSAPMVA